MIYVLIRSSRLERVTEWEDVNCVDILAQHDQIYRNGEGPVLGDEMVEVMDLPTLPLLDDDGDEISIYDADGYRIPRRLPTHSEAYGSWINLSSAHNLFQPQDDNLHARRAMPFNAYPQAFLKTLGNIQSSTVPLPLTDYVRTLNAELAVHVNDEDGGPDHPSPALETVYFQSYNEISHRIRDEARFHPVQLGLITSALSGAAVTNQVALRKWQSRVHACREGLPHQRFENKINRGDQPESLRNEVTYTIHLNRLNPQLRNGRYGILLQL